MQFWRGLAKTGMAVPHQLRSLAISRGSAAAAERRKTVVSRPPKTARAQIVTTASVHADDWHPSCLEAQHPGRGAMREQQSPAAI